MLRMFSRRFINVRISVKVMPKVVIEVPDELPEREVKIAVAVQLYREGKLTLKQVSDLADLCLEDFMKVPSE